MADALLVAMILRWLMMLLRLLFSSISGDIRHARLASRRLCLDTIITGRRAYDDSAPIADAGVIALIFEKPQCPACRAGENIDGPAGGTLPSR